MHTTSPLKVKVCSFYHTEDKIWSSHMASLWCLPSSGCWVFDFPLFHSALLLLVSLFFLRHIKVISSSSLPLLLLLPLLTLLPQDVSREPHLPVSFMLFLCHHLGGALPDHWIGSKTRLVSQRTCFLRQDDYTGNAQQWAVFPNTYMWKLKHNPFLPNVWNKETWKLSWTIHLKTL